MTKSASQAMRAAMSQITAETVAAHGFTPEEYERVLAAMGREPNLLELGIFSVMWSEHCSYKSSRMHLAKLPTKAPWVICGPGDIAQAHQANEYLELSEFVAGQAFMERLLGDLQ